MLRPRFVGKQQANVGKVPLKQLLQTRNTVRAPKSGYSRSDFSFELFGYNCIEHGAEEPLDDAEIRMYSDVIDAEAVHSQRAIDAVLRNYEIAVADAVFSATTWTGSDLTTALTNEWEINHVSTATPIEDVAAAKLMVWEQTGYWPNALVISQRVFNNVTQLDEIIDRISADGNSADVKVCTRRMLASPSPGSLPLVGSAHIMAA